MNSAVILSWRSHLSVMTIPSVAAPPIVERSAAVKPSWTISYVRDRVSPTALITSVCILAHLTAKSEITACPIIPALMVFAAVIVW
jgi:hypothetical protein